MLDKSSVYVLVEGMYFLDKSSLSNFNFLDYPLLVQNVKPGVSFCINFEPFCNILAKI